MLETEFDWLNASKSKWHPRAEKVYYLAKINA